MSEIDEIVEKVARAICRSVDAFANPDAVTLCQETLLVRGEGAKEWERFIPEARAALEAAGYERLREALIGVRPFLEAMKRQGEDNIWRPAERNLTAIDATLSLPEDVERGS